MAKKTKRQVRRQTSPVNMTAETVSARPSVRSVEREFNPDYSPVIKDLRRIGLLAGSFFVVLVVLSFFLK
jgi:hypothetical protein